MGRPETGPEEHGSTAAAAGGERYVRVAVPAPLLTTLTYRLPHGWPASVAPAGVRVRVPLGKRTVTGVVLGSGPPPPEAVEARDVTELLDEPGSPSLSEDLLETVEWIADYYVAPPGEAIRASLPAPVAAGRPPVLTRLLAPSAAVLADPAAALKSLGRAHKQATVLERALAAPMQTRAELARAAGTGSSAVKALLERGMLEETERVAAVPCVPGVDFPVERPRSLTTDQLFAVGRLTALVDAGAHAAVVLHGVTGSGKTEVYLRAAERVLARGRSALFLVPEIGLTPSLSRALEQRFGADTVVVQHSGLGPRQRTESWERARDGRSRVVLGARSALFAPLSDLGLIVVDEEHDGGYKQEESPRYHARDLALVRGRAANAVVVLGSATPSIEAWARVDAGGAELLAMPRRVGAGRLPELELVDMRAEFAETADVGPFSRRLLVALEQTLSRGEQAMVLLNRRGFSSALLCRACGVAVECRRCSIAMTWHLRGRRLLCHYCGWAARRPDRCPRCDSEHLAELGAGTQRLESELAEKLPSATIARLDRDAARSQRRLANLLGRFSRGEIDVMVGTQMIAKGHHFPGVTLVGVISADATLDMPDFRAGERAFQLVTQVAGRAGRGERPGRVVVQAFRPDHPVLEAALAQDYERFASEELASRRLLKYPPAAALANLIVRDREQSRAFERAVDLVERIRRLGSGHVAVLGPTAAPIARLREQFRVQILVRARKRRRAIGAIRGALVEVAGAEGVHPRWLTIDIDPQQLL